MTRLAGTIYSTIRIRHSLRNRQHPLLVPQAAHALVCSRCSLLQSMCYVLGEGVEVYQCTTGALVLKEGYCQKLL